MRVYTNNQLITSRAKWARRIAPLTMFFLIGGLITNFMSMNQPQYFQPTLILLALGFVFATASSHLVNRWVREPRADQVLSATLKKFGNDFALFNYTAPPPHVLLTPSRLYAIVVKNQDGQITVNGRRFSRKFTWSRFFRFFADEGLGSPAAEAENRVDKLEKFLRQNLGEADLPEIKPLIIFTHKDVELVVENADIPVMRTNELKTYLRDQEKSRTISAPQRHKLSQLLAGQVEEAKE
jgi:hypothetical protein